MTFILGYDASTSVEFSEFLEGSAFFLISEILSEFAVDFVEGGFEIEFIH